MTDILSRIEAERTARASDPMRPANPLLRDAADEIAWLRAENAWLQKVALNAIDRSPVFVASDVHEQSHDKGEG